MHGHNCSVCEEDASLICGKCRVARYCSKEHQKQHWKIHKNTCFPLRVDFNEIVGRHLVASRDIKAGEMIISEAPLVAGPLCSTKPVCLGCNGPLNGKFKCNKCGYPMCSPNCPSQINHLRECEVIQLGGKRANVTVLKQTNPMYQCITPLRCLWMKTKAREQWDIFTGMEAHMNERKKSGRCEEVKNLIVKIIRNYFELDIFEEDEIQKVCGVIETNGFEVPELSLVVLFGQGYLLEHSCVPNTTRTFDSRLNLVVTASLDIKAGEHITTTYIDPLWGERIRKVHLLQFKYFTCSCPRCLDPTDFGTHLSSVKCDSCPQGLLVPSKDITAPWKCNACGKDSDAQEIEETLVSFFRLKEDLSPTTSSLEKYLKETHRRLGENHHFRIKTKLALVQMYGKEGQTERDKSSEEDILRKRELCNQVLEVVNLLAPGLSRVRGVILYELYSTYGAQFRKLHKKFKTSSEGLSLIEKAEETLTEALTILKLETHLKEEMQMAMNGELEIKMIKEWKENISKENPSSKHKNKGKAKNQKQKNK